MDKNKLKMLVDYAVREGTEHVLRNMESETLMT